MGFVRIFVYSISNIIAKGEILFSSASVDMQQPGDIVWMPNLEAMPETCDSQFNNYLWQAGIN